MVICKNYKINLCKKNNYRQNIFYLFFMHIVFFVCCSYKKVKSSCKKVKSSCKCEKSSCSVVAKKIKKVTVVSILTKKVVVKVKIF
jgi:hypothetical protein